MILANNNLINQQEPLNAGLVHWWMNLPDGSLGGGKTFRDLCGRSDAVREIAGKPVVAGPHSRPGGFGSVYCTDSVSNESYIAPQNTFVPFGANQRTISLWFMSLLDDANLQYVALTVGGTNSNGRDLAIGYRNNGVAIVTWGGDTIVNSSTLSVYKWYHFTLVVPHGAGFTDDLLYYINGKAGTPDSFTPKTLDTASGSTTIGGWRQDATKCWNGYLDDIRIWNRELRPAEVEAAYRDSLIGYQQTLNWLHPEQYFSAASAAGDTVGRLVNGGLVNNGLVNRGLV